MKDPEQRPTFVVQQPALLVDQVTEYLTKAISEGVMLPGTRLVEAELNRLFKVSRGPIREAFRILEKDGFVYTVARKGTFVRKITVTDIKENLPIRAMLEGYASRLAVQNIDQEQIDQLEFLLVNMAEAIESKNFSAHLKHHYKFHDTVILASRNATLIEILQNLRRRALWFRLLSLYAESMPQGQIRVHREILDMIKKGDAERCEELVKNHILDALAKFVSFLNSKQPENVPAEDVLVPSGSGMLP